MRRDGREFISGGESPRRFSDVIAERPLPTTEDLDEVPAANAGTARPVRANVGYSHLKG